MKQPVLGIVALIIVIIVSMGMISLFEEATFSTWVSFLLMCLVPTQLIMSMIWQTNYPVFLKDMPQPSKGLLMTLITLAIGACVATFVFFIVGKGHGPTPLVIMFTILTIVLTFWFAVLWQCWPVTLFTSNPLIIGISVFLVAYLGGYLFFNLFFNFTFLQGAPIYFDDAEPGGMFMAWDIMVVLVSSVAAIMILPLFDGWPVRVIKNPTANVLVSSLLVLTIGISIYCLVVYVMGMDQITYMVMVPVSFIFGTFLPLTFFQGGLFSGMQQPLKGVVLFIFCAIAAFILQQFYLFLGPIVSGPLIAGPEGNYQKELWLSSALLGLTFPVLVIMLDYFQFWPLVSGKKNDT